MAFFTEKFSVGTCGTTGEWTTAAPTGTVANSVLAILFVHEDDAADATLGIRAVGSSLERKFDVHEGEGGGRNGILLHVQTNSSGQFQYYTSSANNYLYILGAYSTDVTYTEKYEQFTLSSTPTWGTGYAFTAGASCIHEVLLGNNNSSISNILGVRKSGSSLDRYIDVHEAERTSGSTANTWYTSYVEADASRYFEGYGYSTYCYDVGYFSSNVDFLEKFDALTMTTDDTWTTQTDNTSLPGDSSILIEVNSYTSLYASSNPSKVAQTFAGFDGQVRDVYLWMNKVGNTTGMFVYAKLYSTSSGVPDAVLATSDAVSCVDVPYGNFIKFTFSSPYTISSGTDYAIEVEFNYGDASNCIQIGLETTDASPKDAYIYSGSWSLYFGGDYAYPYSINKPEAVAMIACVHQDTGAEEDLGARTFGSSTTRTHLEHEAESNGFTGATYPVWFINKYQTIAGDASEAGFYNLGYLYKLNPQVDYVGVSDYVDKSLSAGGSGVSKLADDNSTNISDYIDSKSTSYLSQFDQAGISEYTQLYSSSKVSVFDGVGAGETVTAAPVINALLFDSVNSSEYTDRKSTSYLNVFDQAGAAEWTDFRSFASVSKFDSSSAQDYTATNLPLVRSLFDSVGAGEYATAAPILCKELIDTVGVSEYQADKTTAFLTLSDLANVSELIALTSLGRAEIYDIVSAGEYKNLSTVIYLNIYDNANAAEVATFSSLSYLNLFDQTQISELVTPAKTLSIDLFDQVGAAEWTDRFIQDAALDVYGYMKWSDATHYSAMRLTNDSLIVAAIEKIDHELNISYDVNNMYQGNVVTPNATFSFDSVQFYLVKKAGDVSTKNYTARVWTVDASENLLEHVAATSAIGGSNSWNGWVDFGFGTDVTLQGGTKYAITVDGGGTPDTVNYVSAAYG